MGSKLCLSFFRKIVSKILLPPRWILHHFNALESTNDTAKTFYSTHHETLSEKQVHVFWADYQTKGRGRMGRVWDSPEGNLYVTFLFPRLCCAWSNLSQFSFVIGVALHKTLLSIFPEEKPLFRLKWPNDMLANEAKIAGILLETDTHLQETPWVVAGVGVNLSSFPDGLPYPATSLFSVTGHFLPPECFLESFTKKLDKTWHSFKEHGFLFIRKYWMKYAAFLRQEITIQLPHEKLHGVFKEIDQDGNLILGEGAKKRVIFSGEILFDASPHLIR